MTKEKEFIKTINMDKAKNKTIGAIILIVLSLLTYIFPLIFGVFDFGIIFEVVSLVFLIIARSSIVKYDEIRAKRYIVCSMVAIGWIMIYDIILFFSTIQEVVDLAFIGYDYLFAESLSILYLIVLFAICRDLAKADNPDKYKESTDWFYEKYEEKDNGGE